MRVPPALRHRDFRFFITGFLPSETGEYIHFVVQNWLVWELTQSAFYLGVIGFFEFAPRFVFGPIGGVITDRVDRRRLIILSGVINLLQVLVFAGLVFFGWLQFWHIVALVILMAVVSSIRGAAQQVFIFSLVPREAVVSALAVHSAMHNLTKVIGPSIGGVLLAFMGPGPCLLVQAVTILWMLAFLFKMRSAAAAIPEGRGAWLKDVAEGVSYLRHNYRVFTTILVTYSNGFFGISYAQFLPYFAQEVLQVGPTGYGLLVSAPGVGAVGISFLLATHTRLKRMRQLLLGASLIYAVAIFLFAISPYFAFSLVVLTVVGAMQMSYRVLARAIIQEECPDHLLGRAMSLFLLDRGFGSLGALCIGSVAAIVSVPLAVAGGAVLAGIAAWGIPRMPVRQKVLAAETGDTPV